MSTLVLLQAHRVNDAVLAAFRRLYDECAGECEVRMLLDMTPRAGAPLPELAGLPPLEPFTLGQLARDYDLSTVHGARPGIYGGNALVPVIDLAGRTGCARVWVIEYDVRFAGSWRDLFRAFDDSDAALLTTTLVRYARDPGWPWFDSLRRGAGSIPRERRIRAFLPVYRLSGDAVRLVAEAWREGWRGHYEVLLPTLVAEAGMPLEDIGGDGEFVRPGNRNRYYTNTPGSRSLAPGTFVCSPVRGEHEPRAPGLLHHPVK